MGVISCTVDQAALLKEFRAIGMDKVPKACIQALNRAASQMQTATVREVSKALKVKNADIKKIVRYPKYAKASLAKLRSKNYEVLKDLAASKFGKIKQTKQGVIVAGRLYKTAFIAKMGKHVGVYRRLNHGDGKMTREQWLAINRGKMGKGNKYSYPIEEIKIEIKHIVAPIAAKNLDAVGYPAFEKRFDHELDRRLKAT